MSLTDSQIFELNTYGKLLTGSESELELAKLQRIKFLKSKFRPNLEAIIGDTPDNVADTVRTIVMGMAIMMGIETNQDLIDGYQEYISSLYVGYGGGENILSVIAGTAVGLQQEVVAGYFVAKAMIEASDDIDYINKIDLYGVVSESEMV
jgi:hypothetical protein